MENRTFAIVTDSLANPTPEQREKYYYEVIPAIVRIEGKTYLDFVDITAKQAFEFMEKNPKDYATAAPSQGDFMAIFKKAAGNGAKNIICVVLTKKLSATWNSARLSKEALQKELPNVRIEVIDSEVAGAGTNLLCLLAGRLNEEGKKLDEIVAAIEEYKKKNQTYVLLDTIRYLYRAGRIPEAAAKLGSILPLKPLIRFKDGTLHVVTAAISRQAEIEKMLAILKDNFDPNFPLIRLMHAECPEEIQDLKEKILKMFPCADIFISEFSPVLGYVTGKKTMVISFHSK